MAFQFREKALRKQGEIEDYLREMGLLEEAEEVLIKEEDGSQTHGDDEMYVLEESAVEKEQEEYLDVDATEQQECMGETIEYLEDNYTIEMNPEQSEIVLEEAKEYEETPSQQLALQEAAKSSIKARRGRVRRGLNSLTTSDGTEKGGYICDVCGNFYEKRGRMMEHRRRHDAVCQYACE